MSEAHEITKAKISFYESQIKIIKFHISHWESELRKVEQTKDWLQANLNISRYGIKLEDVELSSGPDVPYFFISYKFAEYLRAKGTTKPWAEWNRRVYHMGELLCGNLRNPLCNLDDLKGENQ